MLTSNVNFCIVSCCSYCTELIPRPLIVILMKRRWIATTTITARPAYTQKTTPQSILPKRNSTSQRLRGHNIYLDKERKKTHSLIRVLCLFLFFLFDSWPYQSKYSIGVHYFYVIVCIMNGEGDVKKKKKSTFSLKCSCRIFERAIKH